MNNNLESISESMLNNTNDHIKNISASEEGEETEIQIEAEGDTNDQKIASPSSMGKYCKCSNPLMTDLTYETESLCEYTHHHLKKGVGSLFGRRCFDCKGLLNEKIKGKRDFLHWCKNSILMNEDGCLFM